MRPTLFGLADDLKPSKMVVGWSVLVVFLVGCLFFVRVSLFGYLIFRDPRGNQDSWDSNAQSVEIKSVQSFTSIWIRNSVLRWVHVIVKTSMFVVSDDERELIP